MGFDGIRLEDLRISGRGTDFFRTNGRDGRTGRRPGRPFPVVLLLNGHITAPIAILVATQNVSPRRYRRLMVTLTELKEEVDDLRKVVTMADSDTVATHQLLHAHISLINSMREDHNGLRAEMAVQSRVLGEQAQALGALLEHQNHMQRDIHLLQQDVHGLHHDVRALHAGQERMDARLKKMDARQDKADARLDRMDARQDKADARQDRMEVRQDRMDRNIAAIMRHLGVESQEPEAS